jgi:hypothetical protein
MFPRRVMPLLVLVVVSVCAAQDQPAPSQDPAITDPSVPRRAEDMDRPRGTDPLAPAAAPRSDPANPNDPSAAALGLEVADFAPGLAPLRREGTFLVRRRASLVRLRTGDSALLFHKDDAGKAERPMLLTPCANLSRMEHLAAQNPEDVSFLVSGQVYVYQGRNYFLLTLPPVPVVNSVSGGGDDSALFEGPPEPSSRDNPDTEDLLRELEAQRDTPRSIGSIETAPTLLAGEARADPLPEGTIVSRRRGRLVRQGDGQTALLMNTDADTDAAADPPLTLAPSLVRERMEAQTSRAGEALVFEVSGRVLVYEGRNYLVPTMFLVYPTSELSRRE